MAAMATSSNIRARDKVTWSEGMVVAGQVMGQSHNQLLPLKLLPRLLIQGSLTCAWRVKWQLVLRRGDTGHIGPFHLSQGVVVSKGTMEVFIHSQGGQPRDRQGDLGHIRGKQSRQVLLGPPCQRRWSQSRAGGIRGSWRKGQMASNSRKLTWPSSWRGWWAGSRLCTCRQRLSS